MAERNESAYLTYEQFKDLPENQRAGYIMVPIKVFNLLAESFTGDVTKFDRAVTSLEGAVTSLEEALSENKKLRKQIEAMTLQLAMTNKNGPIS